MSKSKIEIRKPYEERCRHTIDFMDENGEPYPSRTEQHHKEACDINNVIRRYDQTGLLSHINTAKATYGDYTEVDEYKEALRLITEAQAAFNDLPSKVRRRFGNDPGEFMEFITNPENLEEARSLGLTEPVKEMEVKIDKEAATTKKDESKEKTT